MSRGGRWTQPLGPSPSSVRDPGPTFYSPSGAVSVAWGTEPSPQERAWPGALPSRLLPASSTDHLSALFRVLLTRGTFLHPSSLPASSIPTPSTIPSLESDTHSLLSFFDLSLTSLGSKASTTCPRATPQQSGTPQKYGFNSSSQVAIRQTRRSSCRRLPAYTSDQSPFLHLTCIH